MLYVRYMISQNAKDGAACFKPLGKPFLFLFLISILLLIQSYLVHAGPRGGGIPPVKKVTEQYRQLVDIGDKQKATDMVLKYASQPRRLEKDRLKLYFMLTDEAIDSDGPENFIRLIEKIKHEDAAIGHFLEIHYFNYTSVKNRVVDSIIWLAKNDSPRLSRIRTTYIWRIYRYTKKVGHDLSFRFLQSLYEYGFPRSQAPLAPESLYLEWVKVLLAEGKVHKAKQVVDRVISSFEIYFYIWHDNRYKALWPYLEEKGKFDPKVGINNEIAIAQKYLESDSPKTWGEWLKVTTKLVEKNRSLANYSEAISIAETAIAEVPLEVQTDSSFFWLQQALVSSYIESGRWSKARSLMEEILAFDLKERPQNINAIINYAGYLLERGKNVDAVRLANQVLNEYESYTSDYGEYYAKAVLVCAFNEQGESVKAANLFASMYREFYKNYYASTHAAVCMKDKNATQNILVSRIKDPEERHYTLGYLSNYTTHIKVYRKPEQMLFFKRMSQSQKVQEALRKYGRTKSWPLPQVYWSEL